MQAHLLLTAALLRTLAKVDISVRRIPEELNPADFWSRQKLDAARANSPHKYLNAVPLCLPRALSSDDKGGKRKALSSAAEWPCAFPACPVLPCAHQCRSPHST